MNDGIEELVLDYDCDLRLDNLPSSIKKIIILNKYYNQNLNNLPFNLEYLELPINYKLKILSIPPNLKYIKCHKKYEYKSYFENRDIKIDFYT